MHSTLLLAALILAADDPAAPDGQARQDKERQEEVARLAPAKARMMELSVGSEKPVKASLHDQPLLRWSNPTVGSVYGEVYVWHVKGQPAAIASIFRWYHPYKDGTVEITSLSQSPVLAREGDSVLWECHSPGVSFHELPDAAVASTRGGRLTQMRALARRFAAELIDERGGEPVTRELRLLNQPLHRYESPEHGVVDGALFALAEVTDPEVIVMIEAFKNGDSLKWRYALARMNNHELHIRLDDKVVQTWPRIHDPWKDRKSSYTLFSFDPQAVNVDKPTAKP